MQGKSGAIDHIINEIVYLYRSVLSKKLAEEMEGKDEDKNEYGIEEYAEIMDAVEDFVFSNI